jgi:DNA-damage-inducible protein D
MKKEIIQSLTNDFESFANQTDQGVEFWLARDLQHLLGYSQWKNFINVLNKAKTSCEVSGHEIADHFADVGKMVVIGSGAEKEVPDIMLTRYACYLIAQNGDPRERRNCICTNLFCRSNPDKIRRNKIIWLHFTNRMLKNFV